jgi:hypothetical protein
MRLSPLHSALVSLLMLSWHGPALAQPAGYAHLFGARIQETSGTALTGVQVEIPFDANALIAAGRLRPDARDVVVTADDPGRTVLPSWLDSRTLGTSARLWVRLDLAAGSTRQLFVYHGNPAEEANNTDATRAGTVFDTTALTAGPRSSTDQVASGGAGGATSSQRGFRFAPQRDVLVVQFGKREPNGTTRYVTLFNQATQAIVHQTQVSGPAAQYSYAGIQPLWLTQGVEYSL